MYTGKLATQLIDPARLEQGVKFLHAYPLIQEANIRPTGHTHKPPLSENASLPAVRLRRWGLIDGKGVTTNKATSLTRPGSKHRHNLTEAEVEASASISQFVREGSEMETSAAQHHEKKHLSEEALYVPRLRGALHSARNLTRAPASTHSGHAPLVLESAGAASPWRLEVPPHPEVEEVLRSSEASAATPIIVERCQ
ncbi:zinc finger and BTB domain-containing protein [Pimephales promelas]|nr:zinc finger and BTB domain-containing protein [Pimephales promelas]